MVMRIRCATLATTALWVQTFQTQSGIQMARVNFARRVITAPVAQLHIFHALPVTLKEEKGLKSAKNALLVTTVLRMTLTQLILLVASRPSNAKTVIAQLAHGSQLFARMELTVRRVSRECRSKMTVLSAPTDTTAKTER